jgi:hypothetical protein
VVVTAWKDLERRVCAQLGGGRSGPLGKGCSDCTDDVPFSVEVKRSQRDGPPVLAKWIAQARSHSTSEGKPWLVVVAGYRDRHPVAALDFGVLVELAQKAGVVEVGGADDVAALPHVTTLASALAQQLEHCAISTEPGAVVLDADDGRHVVVRLQVVTT